MFSGFAVGVASLKEKGTVTCDRLRSLDCLVILASYLAAALGSTELCCLDFNATMATLTAVPGVYFPVA